MWKSFVLAAPILLAACTSPGDGSGSSERYKRSPQVQKQYEEAVKQRRLVPGMKKDEVVAVMRGQPETKDRVTDKQGRRRTRWIYRSRSITLFFDSEGYLVDAEGLGWGQ